MAGPREWSPKAKGARERGEVLIKVMGNLGDENPLDYGGYIIYRVRDPKKTGPEATWTRGEYWHEPQEVDPDDSDKDTYDVFQWDIAPDVLKELNWVDWDQIGTIFGLSTEEVKRLARSSNALERADVYRMVGDYDGYLNLDEYPLTLTRKEMEERWPEFA